MVDTRRICRCPFSILVYSQLKSSPSHNYVQSAGARCSFVDFFFIDTTPFVDQYWTYTKHQYDWRGILPREPYLKKQLKVWLISDYQSIQKSRVLILSIIKSQFLITNFFGFYKGPQQCLESFGGNLENSSGSSSHTKHRNT